ncbi:hypothetical protein AGOR_G00233600 [Albula goreensis]|uniref:Interleukin n=1 Tax=Albula goreensis TaxID=1534307 RepID=A0A8T3CLK4_9TELE|nr:hypothetical protein AGOR_G00233600 [Albula goreensis]
MTAFVVLLALIFLKLYAWNRDSKAKRSVRHACFFCCLRYCQDSPPKGEIWIYFFVWSCLSAAAEAQRQDLIELRTFIENNKQDFKNSDHSYYTPSHDTTNKSCINNTLLCYILEAQVINYETRGGRSITILEAMTEEIRSLNSGMNSCSPCEAFEETNSTTFIKRFEMFIKIMQDLSS